MEVVKVVNVDGVSAGQSPYACVLSRSAYGHTKLELRRGRRGP